MFVARNTKKVGQACCRTNITSFNKNVGYNTNGIRDCEKLLEISQQRKISQTEKFRNKNALDVWKHIHVWEYIHFLRWSKSNLQWKHKLNGRRNTIVYDALTYLPFFSFKKMLWICCFIHHFNGSGSQVVTLL